MLFASSIRWKDPNLAGNATSSIGWIFQQDVHVGYDMKF